MCCSCRLPWFCLQPAHRQQQQAEYQRQSVAPSGQITPRDDCLIAQRLIIELANVGNGRIQRPRLLDFIGMIGDSQTLEKPVQKILRIAGSFRGRAFMYQPVAVRAFEVDLVDCHLQAVKLLAQACLVLQGDHAAAVGDQQNDP